MYVFDSKQGLYLYNNVELVEKIMYVYMNKNKERDEVTSSIVIVPFQYQLTICEPAHGHTDH